MVLCLRPEVSATDTEDGLVLLDGRTGVYFEFNRTATTALRLLLDGATPAETARTLARGTTARPERCLRDVEALVRELLARRLVVTR
jgi:hypothetical protein